MCFPGFSSVRVASKAGPPKNRAQGPFVRYGICPEYIYNVYLENQMNVKNVPQKFHGN